MFCRHCGTPNDDRSSACAGCGQALQALSPQRIENNLVLAIVVTVVCCLPCGIVGIVNAAQVNTKALTGDLAGARESARMARLWSLWGLGLGLVIYTCYGIAAVITGLSNSAR